MVSIDRASESDLGAVLPLVTAYRVFYEQEPDSQRERALMAQHLKTGTSVVFLARLDGDPAGFVQLFQTYSTVWLGPQLILEDLYVKPDLRRSGLATKLLERACAYAGEIGSTGMFLETAMDNVAAQAVYERAGWTREGRFYKYNAPA